MIKDTFNKHLFGRRLKKVKTIEKIEENIKKLERKFVK